MILGNRFLTSTWNAEFEFQRMKVFSEIRLEKGVDYSSIQTCVWACHFVSVRKIPTSLLDKCIRMN